MCVAPQPHHHTCGACSQLPPCCVYSQPGRQPASQRAPGHWCLFARGVAPCPGAAGTLNCSLQAPHSRPAPLITPRTAWSRRGRGWLRLRRVGRGPQGLWAGPGPPLPVACAPLLSPPTFTPPPAVPVHPRCTQRATSGVCAHTGSGHGGPPRGCAPAARSGGGGGLCRTHTRCRWPGYVRGGRAAAHSGQGGGGGRYAAAGSAARSDPLARRAEQARTRLLQESLSATPYVVRGGAGWLAAGLPACLRGGVGCRSSVGE